MRVSTHEYIRRTLAHVDCALGESLDSPKIVYPACAQLLLASRKHCACLVHPGVLACASVSHYTYPRIRKYHHLAQLGHIHCLAILIDELDGWKCVTNAQWLRGRRRRPGLLRRRRRCLITRCVQCALLPLRYARRLPTCLCICHRAGKSLPLSDGPPRTRPL